MRRNASRHLFTWTSTYEPYDDVTGLVQALEYQLRCHERGHARDVRQSGRRDSGSCFSVYQMALNRRDLICDGLKLYGTLPQKELKMNT